MVSLPEPIDSVLEYVVRAQRSQTTTAGEIYEYYFTVYDNANIPSAHAPIFSKFNLEVASIMSEKHRCIIYTSKN